jgi:hypothetical protein
VVLLLTILFCVCSKRKPKVGAPSTTATVFKNSAYHS